MATSFKIKPESVKSPTQKALTNAAAIANKIATDQPVQEASTFKETASKK